MLKAQVLLYAASPLFNGNPNYSNFVNKKGEHLVNSTYDKEKWRIAAEAADSAIQICLQGGKKLISGNVSQSSKLLNTMLDLEQSVLAQNFVNDEAIFMVRPQGIAYNFWFSWTLPYFKSTDITHYNGSVLGCIAPTMKIVEMYYTDHGLRAYFSRYQMSKETNTEYRGCCSFANGCFRSAFTSRASFLCKYCSGSYLLAKGKRRI